MCQIIEDLCLPLRKKIDRYCNTSGFWGDFWRGLRTFIIADIAWIFFRAENVKSAIYILRKSFDVSDIDLILNRGFYQMGLNERNMFILFIGIMVLLVAGIMKERGINILTWISARKVVFRYTLYWSALVLIIFSLDITGQEFIYFQF